jgi:pyridoxal phosphate enzyme (YggS family)
MTRSAETDLADSIRERHAQAMETIAASARSAGRAAASIRLVVVTKARPLHVVQAAIAAGIRLFGENYAEEAVGKIQALAAPPPASPAAPGTPDIGVEWHMIGHVQSRKAKPVAQHFDLVHSVDSVKLARRLDSAAADRNRDLPVLLQFNVGGEPQKHGWPAMDESSWPALVPDVEAIAELSNIRIQGLMTMPPLFSDPQDARQCFRRLRALRGFLRERFPGAQWSELSMGTSADYEVAVEEGATLVRVGEAILGARPAPEHT